MKKITTGLLALTLTFTVYSVQAQWQVYGNGITSADFLGTTNAMPLNFRTGNAQRMQIDVNGRVGIGNTGTFFPKLYVQTNSTNDGIQVNQTGTTSATLDLNASGGGGKRWSFHSTGSGNGQGPGHLLFFDWAGAGERMRIHDNGYIGIGTIGTPTGKPSQKLHVHDGAILMSGAAPGFGGPQLIFSDNLSTHPNGRWSLEYMLAVASRPSMGGLNFWTPWNPGSGSTAGNYSLFLKDDGKVGMGVTDDNGDSRYCAAAFTGNYRLYVNGGILTTGVKVANYCSAAWADYVFEDNYKLRPLSEVEKYTKQHKHLPGIPSAKELEKEGLDLAQMQSLQMEKIEELTLYIIELKKELEQLKAKQ